jgi:MoaA/NifB/PqqE/SkfB family radical SAM enzyme
MTRNDGAGSWRAHPLDGAILWFHPPTGTHVRWDGPPTRRLCRTAPRVVMFGITNRCNLACGFCSRDLEAGSRWSAESAFEMLAGLARHGVLEVAFGGGEPLVFRGFDQLVERLSTATPLAVHFTTNGALLTDERLARLRGKVGEIRVSIYDDNPWEDRLRALARTEVRFGANLLVTPGRLPGLPGLLARLQDIGCPDVALLSYVGDDRGLHLAPDEDARVAEIVAASPVRARLSVCFGDRLDPVPRLFEDGDCGAGVDFVVLTSDGRMKACSFQNEGVPVATAEDVLSLWRERRSHLMAATPRGGCARAHARPRDRALPDGVRIWRGFSGNNSGECVLVGRFDEPEQARRYLDDLLPGFQPGQKFSEEWQRLLSDLDPEGNSPEVMAAVGSTVMLQTEMAPEDDFPGLRSLLWKRGGRAVFTGIHVHEEVRLAAGLGLPEGADLDGAATRLAAEGLGDFHRRGAALFGVLPTHGDRPLPALVAGLEAVASAHGGVVGGELVPVREELDMPALLAARAPAAEPQWLWAAFATREQAETAAKGVEGQCTLADRFLLVRASRISPRLGWFLQTCGGSPELLTGPRLRLSATFWRPKREAVPAAEVLARVRPRLGPTDAVTTSEPWHGSSAAVIETGAPPEALLAVVATADELSTTAWIELEPAPDRLVHALARVAGDLRRRR